MRDEYEPGAMARAKGLYFSAVRKLAEVNRERYAAQREADRAAYHAELKAALAAECERPPDPLPFLRAAGFGDLFVQRLEVGCGVENWPAVAAARAWVDQHRVNGEPLPFPFLCLLGPTSAGKTQAAAVAAAKWVVANRLQRRGGEVEVLSASELKGLALWGQEGERRLAQTRAAGFLLFDDLGTENLSGPVREVLFALLDFRYAHRKRTVLSANMSREALQQRLDQDVPAGQQGRTFRRLSEHGWVAQVSREAGKLWVGGEEQRFPEFDKPKRRARSEEVRNAER